MREEELNQEDKATRETNLNGLLVTEETPRGDREPNDSKGKTKKNRAPSSLEWIIGRPVLIGLAMWNLGVWGGLLVDGNVSFASFFLLMLFLFIYWLFFSGVRFLGLFSAVLLVLNLLATSFGAILGAL